MTSARRAARSSGGKVAASDWGNVPNRLVVCKAIKREGEYNVYYGWASIYSHPSVIALDTSIALAPPGRVMPTSMAQEADRMASMALSLARVV